MKIVLFTDTFPYGTGESFLEDELAMLVNFFGNITIVPLHTGNGELRPLPGGVRLGTPLLSYSPESRISMILGGLFNRYSFMQFVRGLRTITSVRKMKSFAKSYLLQRKLCSEVNSVSEKLGFNVHEDAVFYFYWGNSSVMLVPELKKIYHRAKFIVRFHATDLYEEVSGCIPFRDRIFPLLDMAVPVSESGYRYILERYGKYISKDKVRISHLGVKDYKLKYRFFGSNEDLEQKSPFGQKFSKRDDLPVFNIVSCSSITPVKRVYLILRTLSMLTSEEVRACGYSRIKWVHIGDGSSKRKLLSGIRLIDKSVLRVELMGNMEHREVINYYRKNSDIDLFVQLSSSEGIPVTMMEALCFGIPIIATDVGGVGELLDETSGILLGRRFDLKEAKNAILGYMALPKEKKLSFREGARKQYEKKWDADVNYTEFAALLTELIAGRSLGL